MREILFRGKRKDNGEWVEGSLILTTSVKEKTYIVDSCYCYDECIDEDGYADFDRLNAFEVIPETVGQYTGLTDKNGTRIFEGDIISIPFEEDRFPYEENIVYYEKAEVYFDTEHYGWYVRYFDDDSLSLCEYDDCDITVIGNIHDNPELLKVGDENDT